MSVTKMERTREASRQKKMIEAFYGKYFVYLAKGKRTTEAKYNKLHPELNRQYDEAMDKEWQGWLDLACCQDYPPA